MLPTFDATSLQSGNNRLTVSDYRFFGWFMIGLGLLGVAAGVVVLLQNWHFVQILLRGPVSVTPAQLRKAGSLDALPSPWVSLDGSKVHDTKVRRFVGQRSMQVNYVLVPVEDHYLLTEVYWNFKEGSRLTGYLEEWDPGRNDGGILTEVKSRGYGDKLLPYQMCAAGDQGVYFAERLGLGLLIILVGLVFAAVGRRYLSRRPAAWDLAG